MLRRSIPITWFVICWMLLFQYETFRASYLGPLFHRPLPKLALLFPPAGWIMFYNVDQSYGFAEVRGIRQRQPFTLDPHDIFSTRAVGYDNIRRNILIGVLDPYRGPAFCRYLRRKFPQYDAFDVLYGRYPNLIATPDRVEYQVAYRCQ